MTNDSLQQKIANMPSAALAVLVMLMAQYLPEDKHLVFVEHAFTATVNKIMVIKLVRTITNCGLKEAKDFVEQFGFLMVDEQEARLLQDTFALISGSVKDFNDKPPF